MGEDPSTSVVSFAKISAALEALPAAFVVYDADDRLMICNDAYKRQYHPCEDFITPGVTHEELQWLKVRNGLDQNAEGRGAEFVEDERRRHRSGPTLEEWRDDSGRHMRMLRARLPEGLTVAMRFDITDLREAQIALEAQNLALEEARAAAHRQATIDELTGLTNRRAAWATLQEMAETCRKTGLSLAALQIDLDGFKQVNDGLGHDAGDAVLVEVARRLRAIVPENDLLARLGGDEFVVAIALKPGETTAETCAARIVEDLAAPISHQGRPCAIGASVGVATDAAEELDPARLLKSSDIALYRSKESGRNQFTVFDDALRAQSQSRDRIAEDLSADLDLARVDVFQQPVVEAKNRSLVSLEALARWRGRDGGLMTPEAFMAVAAELKLMSRLDERMLDLVMTRHAAWTGLGITLPPIALNLSLERLRDPDLLSCVRAWGAPVGSLVFEVRETSISDKDAAAVAWNIDGLAELGVGLEIDDFGSAQSSITSVLRLRPSRLKIDRRFTTTALDNEESRTVVRLAVAMAGTLGVGVTGKGVETEHQADVMAKLGCDHLQGDLFGAAAHIDGVPDLLRGKRLRVG